MKLSFRNANISAVVGAVILFAGVYLFRHSDDGVLQALMVVAWIAAFGTFAFLNARDERRRKRSQ